MKRTSFLRLGIFFLILLLLVSSFTACADIFDNLGGFVPGDNGGSNDGGNGGDGGDGGNGGDGETVDLGSGFDGACVIPSGHHPTEWMVEEYPTCTSTGVEYRRCGYDVCKAYERRIVPKTAHVMLDGACVYCSGKSESQGLAFEYLSYFDAYKVVGIGSCTDETLVVPSVYDGKRVCNVDLSDCDSFKTVIVPEGVEYVDFGSCGELVRAVLPASLKYVSSSAFQSCSKLQQVIFTEGCRASYIGAYAFQWCTSLTDINLPENLKKIETKAFENCTKIEKIVIPASVTEVAVHAFSYAYKLTVYCRTESRPDGWHLSWNYSKCPVVWGYQD